MLKLCLKDFRACRWLWLLAVLIFILSAASPIGWMGLMYMLMGALLVFGCLQITEFVEAKNKTEVLFVSLPLKRSTIVSGRYLLAGFLVLAGGAAVFGTLIPVSRLVPSSQLRMNPGLMLSIEGVAGYVFFVSVIVAFYLPFSFGFGPTRGNFWFVIALMAFSAIIFGAERRLPAALRNRIESLVLSPDQDIVGAFIRQIASLRKNLGGGVFILAALAATAAAAGISLALSIRLYEKREL